MSKIIKIVIPVGDPNGIGPEITFKAIRNFKDKVQFTVLCPKNLAELYLAKTGLEENGELHVLSEGPFDYTFGKLEASAGEIAVKQLSTAIKMVKDQEADAIVTGPICKQAAKLAGHCFVGQTEMIQQLTHCNSKAEMLFVADDFRVVPLTRHITLADVPKSIHSKDIVESVISIHGSLASDFGIVNPSIAIAGLNPHAGEYGLLGKEENEEIIPAVKILRNQGVKIDGPFPADTMFLTAVKEAKPMYDVYVTMYHDQALIPIKLLARDSCVNVSINLPVIRTSPAHGTAFDIAGTFEANPMSMIKAISVACEIVKNRRSGVVLKERLLYHNM